MRPLSSSLCSNSPTKRIAIDFRPNYLVMWSSNGENTRKRASSSTCFPEQGYRTTLPHFVTRLPTLFWRNTTVFRGDFPSRREDSNRRTKIRTDVRARDERPWVGVKGSRTVSMEKQSKQQSKQLGKEWKQWKQSSRKIARSSRVGRRKMFLRSLPQLSPRGERPASR